MIIIAIFWCVWKEGNRICFADDVGTRTIKTTKAIILNINACIQYWTGVWKAETMDMKPLIELGGESLDTRLITLEA